MKNFIIVLSLLFSLNIFAKSKLDQNIDDLKDYIRPYLVKIIGESKTIEWLGDKEFELKIPFIPQLSKKAYDISNIVSEKNIIQLSKSDKRKYSYLFIKELLNVVRNKKIDPNELQRWLNTLIQGGSREGVYHAIVLDDTYKRLENFERPLNDSVIQFSKYFFKTYFGKIISIDELEKIDFYSLKRFMVERSLDALDALFIKNKPGVYAWYALVSKDFATKYSSMFEHNKMRQVVDLKRQYQWSKHVPYQHLKSEIIIKLHIVLNQLEQIESVQK